MENFDIFLVFILVELAEAMSASRVVAFAKEGGALFRPFSCKTRSFICRFRSLGRITTT